MNKTTIPKVTFHVKKKVPDGALHPTGAFNSERLLGERLQYLNKRYKIVRPCQKILTDVSFKCD